MKKSFILIFLFTTTLGVFAQKKYSPSVPSFFVKFSPQHMIRNGLWISGEFMSEDKKLAHQISIETIYKKSPNENNGYGVYNSSGVTFEYMFKYYPSRIHVEKKGNNKERMAGFYTGMFVQAGSYKQLSKYTIYTGGFPQSYTEIKNELKTTSFYPGFVFGRQQSIGENIYIDFFVGAGMRIANPVLTTEDLNYDYEDGMFINNSGVMPKIGVTVGIGI